MYVIIRHEMYVSHLTTDAPVLPYAKPVHAPQVCVGKVILYDGDSWGRGYQSGHCELPNQHA